MRIEAEEIPPNVSNFVKSLRDVGYTFEIAVADVLDNCISAGASNISIYTVPKPKRIFCMLDDGRGMSEGELVEAMRLATQNPGKERDSKDLGRFGLGLKTASFSQCKKLTVITNKDKSISLRQWDLDYIAIENKWMLIKPPLDDFKDIPLFQELQALEHGTLVVWQTIDRYTEEGFSSLIDKLRSHLSLVFHRFLEGENNFSRLKVKINGNPVKGFNPFNQNHAATLKKPDEKINININISKLPIIITPFILPHHSKMSQQEWDKYATEEGYIKSQGFYLYRANRLLIHGTWWGLHKASDAHKLVRIRIDIPNNQDELWGIDIKKSKASPLPEIKKDLRRIIGETTVLGSRPYTGRARKIKDKSIIRFWDLVPKNEVMHFGINRDHPIYKKLLKSFPETESYLLETYLKSLEAYLPIESIQAELQKNPHDINQDNALTFEEINDLADKLRKTGLDPEYIERLLKTELFKDRKELFENE